MAVLVAEAVMRRCLISFALLGVTASAFAQQSRPQIQPLAASSIGPWEAVVWGAERRVHFCTLVRTKVPVGEPSYGILVDRTGTVFSVETDAWTLPNAPTEVTVKPSAGRDLRLAATPVSSRRANIDLRRDADLLDQFQASDQVEVRILGVTVRLAFDEFSAARLALAGCAQQIGQELQADR
jgi:hypothetical protein